MPSDGVNTKGDKKKTEEEKKILETPLSANDLFLKQSYNGCSCWIASAWFVKKPMTKYIW